jgi:hypothetical protein
VVEAGGQVVNIDTRPSDAMALAVRAHVPILVSRDVMESAGILPERDITEPVLDSQEPETASEEPSEQRLSVFEDFLSNLELDDLSAGDEDTPDAPKPDVDPEP